MKQILLIALLVTASSLLILGQTATKNTPGKDDPEDETAIRKAVENWEGEGGSVDTRNRDREDEIREHILRKDGGT